MYYKLKNYSEKNSLLRFINEEFRQFYHEDIAFGDTYNEFLIFTQRKDLLNILKQKGFQIMATDKRTILKDNIKACYGNKRLIPMV